jgi:hypothetical protein
VVVTKAEVVEVGEGEAEEVEGDFVDEVVMVVVVEGDLVDAVEVTIHIELYEKRRIRVSS